MLDGKVAPEETTWERSLARGSWLFFALWERGRGELVMEA
ncbi:MAG: hypothetical protein K0S65_5224, partial [Labilithrix sp.]|nr:hypothetical protein [Labilithrix sp.]